MDVVKIMRNNAAIDAGILMKDRSVEGVMDSFSCNIADVAAIGDEMNDLPLLRREGLGLVGAPLNAQEPVRKELFSRNNGYVSNYTTIDGFIDFYEQAKGKGITVIISDRDGVLKGDNDLTGGKKFQEIAQKMGQDSPYVVVLTGSSYEQNFKQKASFVEQYGLDGRLASNPKIRENPYIFLCESGAVHVNILTGERRNYVDKINPELVFILKKEFEPRVKSLLEKEVLPVFGFKMSYDYADQIGKVYHCIEKLSMVTFNVPHTDIDGKLFRKSLRSDQYRDLVVQAFIEVAKDLKMPYELAR